MHATNVSKAAGSHKGTGAPDQPTSISRKFSGGPYSSSKLCDRASGRDCIVGVDVEVEAGSRLVARELDINGGAIAN